MKFFTLCAALLFCAPMARAEFPLEAPPPGMSLNPLFTLSSDRDDRSANIHAMVDPSKVLSGVYMEPNSGSQVLDSTAKNIFWLEEIEAEGGALLLEVRGYKVAFLQGKLDRTTQEGLFQIRYLANGLTNKYESCDFYLRRNGKTWYVQNAYNGQLVRDVKVITWSLGVKTIDGICKPKDANPEDKP